MTSLAAKEIVVSWDGDAATWGDYTRKVRLQFEKTPAHKRKHLGPDLASRLTGRAWAVTPSLDHELLNGTKYLLRFLRDRLCRLPTLLGLWQMVAMAASGLMAR